MEEFIPNLLYKYDDSLKKYNKIKDLKKKIFFNQLDTNSRFDGRMKIFSKKDYFLDFYFLGSYIQEENIWIWSWCNPLPLHNIQLGKTLIDYALNYDDEKLKREDFDFIRSILINSRVKINDDYNLEILKGLILYITNVEVIVPIEETVNNKKVIYYYGISNIENKIYE